MPSQDHHFVMLNFGKVFTVYNHQKQIEIFGWPLVDVIGALTFLIVLLTLYASLRAAKESARANMLSSLPLLTLSYDYSKDEVIIENSGTGIAVNIKVDKFYNWWADKDFELYGLTSVNFKKIPLLKHGEKRILEAEVKGVMDPFGLTKFTMFSEKQKPLIFAIFFSDLSGSRYVTKVRIYQKKVEIALAPRRFGIFNRIRLVGMRLREAYTMGLYFTKTRLRKYKDKRSKTIS